MPPCLTPPAPVAVVAPAMTADKRQLPARAVQGEPVLQAVYRERAAM